ncbi:hypothetical protein [Nocardioides sp.]|uniref:hypothetical protein n=1 Tax=Nocardioides sp. TaxID=35761 RepID=UPI002636252F|nr:hypothetical protein [Nocardioides sp.]MCW2738857.1 hypothetical protein [Nocardioides sp.]
MTTTIQTAIPLRSKELSGGEHLDTRPCPPWCWVAADNPDGFPHETDPARITVARHTLGDNIAVCASLYGADWESGEVVRTATFEVALEQDGAEEPQIEVALRHYKREKGSNGLYSSVMHWDPDRLRLTAQDAREMALVLTHLANVADCTA